MQIALVATQFSPIIESTATCEEVSFAADRLVEQGHNVHIVVPFPAKLDPNQHSLARRLRPIKLELGGSEHKCVRYDGRTTNGATIHLLDIDDIRFEPNHMLTVPQATLFARFAQQILSEKRDPIDLCLSWGSLAGQSAIIAAQDQKLQPHHLFIISEPQQDADSLSAVIDAAKMTVLTSATPTNSGPKKSCEIVQEAISNGRAIVLHAQPVHLPKN